MKNLLLLFLFISAQIGFSQGSYNELPDNQKELYKIFHVYSDGTILAYTDYPKNIFISSDLGETWNVLIHDIENFSNSSSYSNYHEDLNDKKYISYKNELFSINENNFNLISLLEFDSYEYIEDFNFLPNGNIVVAENRWFRLYDPNFQLIKEVEWWTHSAQILIGSNDNHYVTNSLGASSTITRFDDNLSLFGGVNIPHYRDYYYENGRIFGRRQYSDDGGLTWINYLNAANSYPELIGVEGSRVLISNGGNLLLSNNYGTGFNQIEKDEKITFFSGYLHSGNAITLGSTSPKEGLISTTYNNGGSYISFDTNLGSEFALKVSVDDLGYAFVSYGSHIDRYVPFDQKWDFNTTYLCDAFGSNLLALANSTVLVGSCITSDHGETWDDNGIVFAGIGNLIDKDEVLYEIDFMIKRSFDFAKTWEFYEHPLIEFINNYGTTVSGDGNIIVFEDFFLDEDPKIYFADGSVEIIDFPHQVDNIVSAYSGSTVYLLRGNLLEFELYRSENGYSDYNLVEVPSTSEGRFKVKVDRYNNLYLYNDKEVYISSDEGNSWTNISPTHQDVIEITDVSLGYDNHIYLSTIGTSILKSEEPISEPNKLDVIVFEDINDNCVFDAGEESMMSGFKVRLNDKFTKISKDSDPIQFNLSRDINEMSIVIDESIYSVCDFGSTVEFSNEVDQLTKYIPVSIIKECTELQINASIPFLRRCFENEYVLEVQNNGSIAAEDVVIEVELDEHFEFVSCNFPILSTDGQKLTIEVGDIDRNDKERVKIKFVLSCEAELGQNHYMNARALFDNSCSGRIESNAFECRVNIGSYDPNDKTAFVGGVANTEVISKDEEFEYVIRFQNTGSDTAFTVRIEDPIISKFEESSLQVVASSHDYEFSSNRGLVTFLFQNILLPDSTTNEKESHGFIKFKIDVKEEVEPGDIVTNKARIYFDFNDPIETNSTLNYVICKNQHVTVFDTICPGESSYGFEEAGQYYDYEAMTSLGCDSTWILYLTVRDEADILCDPVSTFDRIDSRSVTIYPNPSQGQIFFKTENVDIGTVSLLDLQGRRMQTLTIIDNGVHLDVSSGIYFLELIGNDGWRDIQKVVLIEK